MDVLDKVERDRLAGYRQEADRTRSALGAAVLRLAVQRHAGVPAASVVVDRLCAQCGKAHSLPRLPGIGLWASISHSGDWVAVAVTDVGPVGVDVERVGRVGFRDLAPRVLTAEEAAAVTDVRDFLVCWTRKESVLKATGEGIAVELAEVDVGRPDRPPALGRHPTRPGLAARMFDLAPRAEHLAALTVLTEREVRVRERDAAELLT